jgi:hypothetical protein
MKFTDDYTAKYKIWAKESKVHPLPRIVNFPRFGAVRFNSYEEMNEWKRAQVAALARQGGVKWMKQ